MGKTVVATRGLDNCLFLYTIKEWKNISENLSTLGMGQADTRGLSRFMFSGAVEVEVDSIGRILVPDFLKEFAKLGESVVFAGINNRVEIWNEELWMEYKKKIEKQGDILAEKLGEIGVF